MLSPSNVHVTGHFSPLATSIRCRPFFRFLSASFFFPVRLQARRPAFSNEPRFPVVYDPPWLGPSFALFFKPPPGGASTAGPSETLIFFVNDYLLFSLDPFSATTKTLSLPLRTRAPCGRAVLVAAQPLTYPLYRGAFVVAPGFFCLLEFHWRFFSRSTGLGGGLSSRLFPWEDSPLIGRDSPFCNPLCNPVFCGRDFWKLESPRTVTGVRGGVAKLILPYAGTSWR